MDVFFFRKICKVLNEFFLPHPSTERLLSVICRGFQVIITQEVLSAQARFGFFPDTLRTINSTVTEAPIFVTPPTPTGTVLRAQHHPPHISGTITTERGQTIKQQMKGALEKIGWKPESALTAGWPEMFQIRRKGHSDRDHTPHFESDQDMADSMSDVRVNL